MPRPPRPSESNLGPALRVAGEASKRMKAGRCASHRRDRAVNVLAALVLTLGAGAAVMTGADAQAGQDNRDRGPAYPAGAAVTHFKGMAFDTCIAPKVSTMRAWLKSPYRAVGIYVSGTERACKKQPNLTREWVTQVTAMGWKLLPLDVGRQPPCRVNTKKKPINPDYAEAQGQLAAQRIVKASAALGILPGSALWTDMEYYKKATTKCRSAVADFVSGWTKELHTKGYLAGMYSHFNSGTKDAAARYYSTKWTRPDAVWTAQWDGDKSLTDWPGVDLAQWANMQRIKQYRGDHWETHGGVSVEIDSSLVDAPVATVAMSRPVATAGTSARRAPRADAAQVGTLVAGGTAAVLCHVVREDERWYKLTDGSYLPESALASKANLGTQSCAYPAPVLPEQGAMLRGGPATSFESKGALPLGALAWVECRHPDRPSWLGLAGGTWIYSGNLGLGGAAGTPLPRCERPGAANNAAQDEPDPEDLAPGNSTPERVARLEQH